jgi:uncharacterized protein (TIGR00251 family)
MKPIPDPVLLDIRVKPRAKRAGILGRHGSALKVAVRAAPERGRANAELVQVLAQALGLPAAAFELVAGATSQDKRVRGLRCNGRGSVAPHRRGGRAGVDL